MSSIETTMSEIARYAGEFNKDRIGRILFLYQEPVRYIGDTCMRIGRFELFRKFFNNAYIAINFIDSSSRSLFESLTRNNPYIDEVSDLDLKDIDISRFDLVFCVAYDEERILQIIHQNYGEIIEAVNFRTFIYSLSSVTLDFFIRGKYVFPEDEAISTPCCNGRRGDIYINKDEEREADAWLEARGVTEEDSLFVILDSTSDRIKLIRMDVHFGLLTSLLEMSHVKMLIFDEGNKGKQDLYLGWLGDQYADRLIFSKGLGLRENMCLMASRYTTMIFGPCTGLIHCAVAIYLERVNRGMDPGKVPAMITYTGKYNGRNNPNLWWEDTPMVDCLTLKERNGKKEVILLEDLSEEEKVLNDSLPCSHYTLDLLLNFITRKITTPALS